eukprot:gene35238-14012_t
MDRERAQGRRLGTGGAPPYRWTVAAVELATFAAAAQLQTLRAPFRRRSPLWLYAAMGVCMAMSQSLGKIANRYVNFTVGTIFKCAKIVPTMVISVVYLRRRYGYAEVGAAGSMEQGSRHHVMQR